MAKIIHTADLHLKDGDEKPYCFAVLDEIIALALSEGANYLVIAGDLFDSFSDFEALRKEVCLKLEPLAKAGCETVYIPGNHEALGGSANLAAYNLDPLRFYARPPFAILDGGGVEFLCVPHAESYDGYREWNVPAKKPGVTRVAVIHALNSTIYTGPDPEAEARAGVVDDDFFARFSVDYAAMGHVHSGRQQLLGGAIVCYPGSPRVWRAHPKEAGPKSVCFVDTGSAPVTVAALELKSAGQYKEYTLPLGLDGAPDPAAADKVEAGLSPLDLVCVTLTGLVEDEHAAAAAAKTLEERLSARARRVQVKTDTSVAAEISGNSLVRAFLSELEKAKPADGQGEDYRAWLLARQYGLEALALRLGEGK
ncbi:MAG: DNA repair exonuclease [Elusimicrobia bacterium]|nr:DNA repair exonuclease [Elusimicrobiota bacterium]